MYYRLDAAAGMNVYGCTATNSWTLEQGPPAASMASQLGDFACHVDQRNHAGHRSGLFDLHAVHSAVRCAGVFVRQRRHSDHFGRQRTGFHLRFERGHADGGAQRDGELQQRLRSTERGDRVSRGCDSAVHLVGDEWIVGRERRRGSTGVPEFEERNGRDGDHDHGDFRQDAVERGHFGDRAAHVRAGDIQHGLHGGIMGHRRIVFLFVHGTNVWGRAALSSF